MPYVYFKKSWMFLISVTTI